MPAIALRPETDADLEFLLALYGSTREEELLNTGWTRDEKDAFILHQFTAQRRHWRENYTDTSWDIVTVDGAQAGRLYVGRWREEIRVVDIALAPPFRNGGIGTELLRGVLAEGDASGRRVSIHVETFNPARRLYERLGFSVAGEHGVYLRMERPVSPSP